MHKSKYKFKFLISKKPVSKDLTRLVISKLLQLTNL